MTHSPPLIGPLTFAEKLIAESLAASDRQAAIDEIDTLKRKASPLSQSAIGEVMAREVFAPM